MLLLQIDPKAANMAGVPSAKDVIKVLLDAEICDTVSNHVILSNNLSCHLLQIEPHAANMAGVLSMKDVIKVLLDDRKHEVDAMKDYIHGSW